MDVFDLYAKINLDTREYENNLAGASRNTSKFGDTIKSGLATAGKVSVAVLTAAGTAVGALAKASLDGYAEYEQLVGGAKLMFADAYDFIAQKASDAYSTVQMSQNDYLQQVNGFATGLKTALNGDEQAAAQLADRIVTAEADIVAATGNTQENIQNAFNGIMKSNYTMLDNLQIGIKPTKEGFQEVIDKVNEWNAANGKATHYMIDNLADAESALIDYIEMQGLSGYASAEAADTIQGSTASMKAAWSNLVVGIANENQNLDGLIQQFVDSVATAANNILPRISTILSGIGTMIKGLAPVIAKEIPSMVSQVLPSLLDGAMSLIQAVVDVLPQLAEVVVEIIPTLVESILGALPSLVEAATQIVVALAEGLAEALPDLIPAAVDAVVLVVETLIDNLPLMLDAGKELVFGLWEGIFNALPGLIAELPQIITGIVEFFASMYPTMIESGMQLFLMLVGALPDIIDGIVEVLPEIITAIITALIGAIPQIIEAGITLLTSLVGALPDIILKIVEAIPQIIDGIYSAILDAVPEIIEAGVELLTSLITDLPQITIQVMTAVPQIIAGLLKALVDSHLKIVEAGVKLFEQLVENLPQAISTIVGKIPEIISGIVSKVRSGWNDLKNAGQYLIEGLGEGIKNATQSILNHVSNIISRIKSMFTSVKGFDTHSPSKWSEKVFENVMKGAENGLQDGAGALVRSAGSVVDRVKDGFDTGFAPSGYTSRYGGAPITVQVTVEGGAIASGADAEAVGRIIGEKAARQIRYRGGVALA